MEFQAKVEKGKIVSQSYTVAKNIEGATHIKLKDGSFELITSELIIYKAEGDNEVPVHYSDIVGNPGTYFIKKQNKSGKIASVEIDTQSLYSHVVVMAKSDKGSFYKCADGRYIHKDEIQIPAYKKIDADLQGPVADGELYVDKDGKQIKIEQVLFDDANIVDVSKLEKRDDGKWVLKDVIVGDGDQATVKDVVIGDKNPRTAELEKPFVQINSIIPETKSLTFKKDGASLDDKKHTWIIDNDENGLKTIQYNKKDEQLNCINCHYDDGSTVCYIRGDYKLTPPQKTSIRENPNIKIYRVKDIKSANDSDNIAFEFEQAVEIDKSQIEQDINFVYSSVDNQIDNITWEDVDGVSTITSYNKYGITVKDIVWDGNRIKSCKVVYDVGGNKIEEDVDDIYNSKYAASAIEITQIDAIENIAVNENDEISFKLGNYTIMGALINADGSIGKCKIKVDNDSIKDVRNLANDTRFAQLRLLLQEYKIQPLIKSKLYEKKNGEYKVVADIVQKGPLLTDSEFIALPEEEQAKLLGIPVDRYNRLTDEQKKNLYGICKAHGLNGMTDALAKQKEFLEKPHKTFVIDDKDANKSHELNDFTKYAGTGEVTLDSKVFPNIVGKSKVEVVNGKIKIDSKKTSDKLFSLAAIGFGVAAYCPPITLALGLPLIMAAGVGTIVAPIARAIKAFRIKHANPERLLKKTQENVKKLCNNKVYKYTKQLHRELRKLKKHARKLSPTDYSNKQAEIKETYLLKCQREISSLQVLAQGELKVPFDLGQNSSITNANLLGFLMSSKQESERKNTSGYKQALDDFKNSNKYLSAKIGKERRQLLKAKKDELLKTARVAKSMKVCEEQNGKYELYANALLAYTQNEVTSNATDRPKKLKLKPDMKLPDGSVNFIDTIAHKIHRDTSRRCEYDQGLGSADLANIKQQLDNVNAKVENISQNTENVIQSGDFEALYKAGAECYGIYQEVAGACSTLETARLSARFTELNKVESNNLKEEIQGPETKAKTSHNKVKNEMESKRKEYEAGVERWAMADFVQAHKTEFEAFLQEFYKSDKDNVKVSSERSIMEFKDYLLRKAENESQRRKVTNELKVFEVKNNVEKRVQAEVICEQEQTEYEAWVNQHAGLDPEISKCIYYAYRVGQDTTLPNRFKVEGSNIHRACQAKANEMLDSEQLKTSQEKQKVFDELNREVEEKRTQEIERQAEEQIELERQREEQEKLDRNKKQNEKIKSRLGEKLERVYRNISSGRQHGPRAFGR